MPFDCRAKRFVLMSPPGEFDDPFGAMTSIEEREDGLFAFVGTRRNGRDVRVELRFDAPYAYCVANESWRRATIRAIAPTSGLLFRVEGSEWVARFRAESDCDDAIDHFLVITGDDWLDVLGSAPAIREL